MWNKNHIIRKTVIPFLVFASLTGAAALPASAAGAESAPAQESARKSLQEPKKHTKKYKWWKPRSWSDPGLVSGDPRKLGAKTFKGQAFDTCRAPSTSVMRAWRKSSPFGAAGVYIGGRARACPNQAHLDSAWVRAADAMGWKLLPVYVGSQSPCVKASNKRGHVMSHHQPALRGAQEGRDAVRQAKKLGMSTHSAIYLDMEAYDNNSTTCAVTTLRFIQGWNRAVLEQKYVPGFYSSADSGIRHMEGARKAGRTYLPQMLWFARWRVPGSVKGEKFLDERAWQPHRRIHQYDGDVVRTYGGHSLHIDRNVMDAPVAVVK
ncbi:DUF1906 domain-containing protein [Streptomyces albidus (ex Kaewkla and Franco 2022)]|uniref:DUF1906 domain-containing protein n=1 Tax=Streptomyces albidus (ex Kaewkla and Franco 2022) TaxID=722709 RepID=UPI0015EEDFEF|nr:DUF1906 domain-containing protein [Streptomyces albidus (ex Kaewkla and Franco 2022)]